MISLNRGEATGTNTRWCVTDKPCELWSVDYQLMEECYWQRVEKRCIDPGNEVLQIFIDSIEAQLGEDGEEGACL